MEERFALIRERIMQLPEETGDEYFREVSSFLINIIKFFEDKKSISQDELYRPVLPENYHDSYLFPPKAKAGYGEYLGALYSALYADLVALAGFAARGESEKLLIFLELFVEIYGIFCCDREQDEYEAAIRQAICDFYHDYADVFVSESIIDTVAPEDQIAQGILAGEYGSLKEQDYLYSYGAYIGANEKAMSAYLASLGEDWIRDMAETFANGYIKGFEVTGKDITKKHTVKLEYPIGFERMAKAAMDIFEEHGLKVSFTFEAALSFTGRGGPRRGIYSVSCNRDFDFDHSDDLGLYMDKRLIGRKLEVITKTYEEHKDAARVFGGPAVIEIFGEKQFAPHPENKNYKYTEGQERLNLTYASENARITDRYIPGEERSFTIIAYPIPEIGPDFEAIFGETIRLNTLDYEKYRRIQQIIIDTLDEGEYVRVCGAGDNETDMTVMLHELCDPRAETNFENCVADVNIPVGEVFTSPVLEGTRGVLFVSHAYLGEYEYHDLRLEFSDGMITDYSCGNFPDKEANEAFIKENILHHHESLPIGEFAIGTNTTAYRMARDFGIEAMLPILIMEKTGPHFAVGDTCYSHAEDVPMKNPDGKECIARDNSCSIKRISEDPKERNEAYFNCHTDITIPFSELGAIYIVRKDKTTKDIIRDGRFVLPGCEELNEPL